MSLAIPNTTTQNAYAAATTFPPEQGAGTPFASGYLVIANNPATVSVLRGRSQGAASWGADFSYAPTTLPLSSGLDPSTGQIRDFIFGVRFKSAIPGSPAQVFGGLFQLGDVTLSPANQFTGTLTTGGGFTPAAALINGLTGWVQPSGAIGGGSGFTVVHNGNGDYTVSYPAFAAPPIALANGFASWLIVNAGPAGTTSTRFIFKDAGGVATDTNFYFAVIAIQ